MNTPRQNAVGQTCAKFLDSLGTPAFILLAWKKEDGSIEVIQSIKEMHPLEYTKAMTWAQNEVLEGL